MQTIRADLDGNVPFVRLGRNAMRQCMRNELVNSIQAMPSGGTLTVKTWCSKRAEGDECCDEVVVTIRDSGVGGLTYSF